MTQSIILTDLDNTLYNWVDYFGPTFRAMVHALSEETKIDENIIIADFKRVFEQRGTVEYAFSVQELDICRSMAADEIARLVRKVKGTFGTNLHKHLKPYDGVKETLTWAARNGVQVIGVSNSPLYHANNRLKQLHLDHLFTGLAGWEGYDIPSDNYPWLKEIRERSRNGGYSFKMKKSWSLSLNELKPSTAGYLRIMSDLNASPENIYVIGDSLHKDVEPALVIGAVGIWAKYGQEFDPKNFETLLKITHWKAEKISAVYDKESVEPTFVVDSFRELQRIVQPLQLQLEVLI